MSNPMFVLVCLTGGSTIALVAGMLGYHIGKGEQRAEFKSLLISLRELITSHNKVHDSYANLSKTKDDMIKLVRKDNKRLVTELQELENLIQHDAEMSDGDTTIDEDSEDDLTAYAKEDEIATAAITSIVEKVAPSRPSMVVSPSAKVALELYTKIKNTRDFIAQDLGPRLSVADRDMLLNSLAVDEKH